MLIYILRFNLQLVPNHILILYGDKAKGTKMILISFSKKKWKRLLYLGESITIGGTTQGRAWKQ